jgi:glycosyltransferase involved in cell wall biosynthesis
VIKVAHLTSVHPTFDVRVFQKECKSLVKHGYHVTLVAPHGKDEIIDGVQVVNIPKKANRLVRIFSSSYRMYKIARKLDAKIFHFHDTELIPVGFFLALTGKKVVYDMHENMPGFIATKEWIPKPLRMPAKWAFQSIEKLTLNRFYVLFAETSYAQDYGWLKRTSIILNYPLADYLLSIKAEKHSEPTVGYVGDVNASRGARITVDALEILATRGQFPKWMCIGRIPDELRHSIDARAEKHGLKIEMTGFVKSTEAHPQVARTHIGLAVIDRIPNHIGSLSTKLFEYMALGMPLITSDFPMYKELIEGIGCGICVAPEKPEELANAIEYLLANPDVAEQMGRKGKAAVIANYNWATEEKKLLGVYQQLLASN